MVEIYNFLVAHPRPGHDLNLVSLYPVLKEWVHKAVGKVDRCGGKSGLEFSKLCRIGAGGGGIEVCRQIVGGPEALEFRTLEHLDDLLGIG